MVHNISKSVNGDECIGPMSSITHPPSSESLSFVASPQIAEVGGRRKKNTGRGGQ